MSAVQANLPTGFLRKTRKWRAFTLSGYILALLMMISAVQNLDFIERKLLWVQSCIALAVIFAACFGQVTSKTLWATICLPRRSVGLISCAVFALTSLCAMAFVGWHHIANIMIIDTWIFWIVAPVFEELFFRGVVQNQVARLVQPRFTNEQTRFRAIYYSSLLFLVFHFPMNLEIWVEALSQGGLPLDFGPFFLGIWTGMILSAERSLAFCVVAHFLANFFAPVWGVLLVTLSSQF